MKHNQVDLFVQRRNQNSINEKPVWAPASWYARKWWNWQKEERKAEKKRTPENDRRPK